MPVVWGEVALLADGWASGVRAEIGLDGRVALVVKDAPPEGHRVGVLLPAPGNLHSHAFQRAMAGLTERRGPNARDTFWTWRQLMYRFLDRLTPDHVQAIAALVQVEMLEAGFASVGEFHYLHHGQGGQVYDRLSEMAGRIVAAADVTGIGLTLLPVQYQTGGCDGRPVGEGQARFYNDPERYLRLLELAGEDLATLPGDAVLGVAPHSLRAVPPEVLTESVRQAKGRPLHIHVAEQQAEVDEVLEHWGARPVEWLFANAAPDPSWCLIHATQMTSAETETLARSGAVAGLCPITEANLGDGIFDGARYQAAGGRWGVGSDSNLRISLAEELRLLEYSQRLRDRARAVLATQEKSTGRILFETAAKGGAQALGRGAGAIQTGAWADLLALDKDAIDLRGRNGDAILDSFVMTGARDMVRDVWAAGRHMVREGRHVARDAVRADYRAVIDDLGDAL